MYNADNMFQPQYDYWYPHLRRGELTAVEHLYQSRLYKQKPEEIEFIEIFIGSGGWTTSVASATEPQIFSELEWLSILKKEINKVFTWTEARKSYTIEISKHYLYFGLFEAIKAVKDITEAIAIARLAGFESTANRLGELYLAEEELEYDEQPLSLQSVKEFLRFIIEHGHFREPYLAVSGEGNVVAIWQKSNAQIFWIEFYPNGDVQYLAYVPNEKRSDGIERTSGRSTILDVYDRAKSLGAIDLLTK
ncbi:MAG: hypothetical protein JRI33_02920 [Deltaproteobacteria bacterium]|nr:hypothetical protein [Deltaproteobacteria bacterium]